jgi:ribosomal protein L11 methylase PrmA
MHVVMNSRADSHGAGDVPSNAPKFSKAGLDLMLASLARCIRNLELPSARGVHWGAYEGQNSYSDDQRAKKRAAIAEFVQCVKPRLVLDIGCNAGEYTQVALEAGAQTAVGLERDGPALNRAVSRADEFARRFLPLQIDVQNTSPALGWDLDERRALRDRLKPDALLCLALIHHLVLTEGVPLAQVISGIVRLAPRGIIEFVPPDDPMSRRILGRAERLTHPYDFDTFLSTLSQFAEVAGQILLGERGRVLVEYRRK